MELTVVLDTNAYSDWRRKGRWHEMIAHADRLIIPVIVLGELYHGFRKGFLTDRNLSDLDAFLREPQVEAMTVTHRTAEIYGEIFAELQNQGTPIPTNDVWIAAMTVERSALLATSDTHFDFVPRVTRLAE